MTVVSAAEEPLPHGSTARAASNSHSDGESQSLDSEAPTFGADAQAIFTGDWNTARAGSFGFLMSLNIPEIIEGYIQFLDVDEDTEDNKLCVQHLLVDHQRQGIQEEVDEVLWRILR